MSGTPTIKTPDSASGNIKLTVVEPYKHFRSQGMLCAFEWNLVNGNSYGGGLATQSVMALYQSFRYPEQADFAISTLHCYFIKGAKRDIVMDYKVRILRDGKTSSHREVCGYQNGAPVIKLMAFFKRSARIAKAITYKKGPQPTVEYSLRQFYKFEEHHPNTEYLYDSLNLARDFTERVSVKTDAVSLFVPKGCDASLIHVNDIDVHSSDINNRHLFTVVQAHKNSKSTLFRDLLSYTAVCSVSMVYRSYLVFVSDLFIMSSVKDLIGSIPETQSGFNVSIDHSMYFNDLLSCSSSPEIEKKKLNIYEPHLMIHELIKGENGQYTVKLSIFNRWDQCVAIAVQEGLMFVDNNEEENKKKIASGEKLQKMVFPTKSGFGTKKANSKL